MLLLRYSVAMVLLLACCGCPATTSQRSGSDGQALLRFAVIPKGTSHEFWKSVHYGAALAAEESGQVEIVWRGPVVESDTGSQIEVVKGMISKQVDGIILAPNQRGGLVDAVEEAIAEGIPVVIFDSGLDEGPQITSYVATDNFRGGQLAAEQLAQAINEEGNVVMLRYLAGSESTEQREEGFLDRIAQYPDIKVLSSDQYAGDNATSAKQKTDQILQLYGDQLDGLFTVCEPNANGALESLRNAGLNGKVKFVAFDPSDALIEALGDGSCHGILLQDPVQMGYQAVQALLAAKRGETVEPFISTGEYVATPDNLRDETIARLLKPQLKQ